MTTRPVSRKVPAHLSLWVTLAFLYVYLAWGGTYMARPLCPGKHAAVFDGRQPLSAGGRDIDDPPPGLSHPEFPLGRPARMAGRHGGWHHAPRRRKRLCRLGPAIHQHQHSRADLRQHAAVHHPVRLDAARRHRAVVAHQPRTHPRLRRPLRADQALRGESRQRISKSGASWYCSSQPVPGRPARSIRATFTPRALPCCRWRGR